MFFNNVRMYGLASTMDVLFDGKYESESTSDF